MKSGLGAIAVGASALEATKPEARLNDGGLDSYPKKLTPH
jgi:hypothetical protein